LLTVIVVALIAGVISQIIAVYLGIPSIVFLLIFGVILGPELLNFVDPGIFGSGFEVLIRLFVAIILFEAGLNLEKEEIKKHRAVILPLVTVGAIITMFGAAIFARFIIDFDWPQAFLFGSLVIVTGPTVIQPLLRRIHVKSNLKNILEFEGVFIDPIGAIVAIFVFEIVLQIDRSLFTAVNLAFLRFGVGLVIGLIGGYLISFLIKKFSIHLDENQDFFVLAFALGIYALSESILAESGLMAAVASGVVVGNMHIPNEQNLKKFKGKISILFISLLFVLLAASLELDYVYDLGYKGVLIVLALIFVVRPLTVFISSINSELKTNEKLFISYISPRGIVAASIASLIGIELKKRGIEGGESIQGLVFLTIAITVIFQGLTVNAVSKLLKVTIDTKRVVIVGANEFGRLIGKLLVRENMEVCLIDTNERLIQKAWQEGLNAVEGNSLDINQLEKTGIDNAESIIAVTTSDKVNLFVCRLAMIDFGLKNVLPVVNQSKEGIDHNALTKLNLDLALGKPLNIFEINSKISHKNYIVISIAIVQSSEVDEVNNLIMREHIVPILYKKDSKSQAMIYKKGIKLLKGWEIVLIDFDPTSTDLEFVGDNEKEVIDI
jgi:NhaP-type Na+/H+ or K+/H+ antiporter